VSGSSKLWSAANPTTCKRSSISQRHFTKQMGDSHLGWPAADIHNPLTKNGFVDKCGPPKYARKPRIMPHDRAMSSRERNATRHVVSVAML
jgi:hypothetical protein